MRPVPVDENYTQIDPTNTLLNTHRAVKLFMIQ